MSDKETVTIEVPLEWAKGRAKGVNEIDSICRRAVEKSENEKQDEQEKAWSLWMDTWKSTSYERRVELLADDWADDGARCMAAAAQMADALRYILIMQKEVDGEHLAKEALRLALTAELYEEIEEL